MAKIAIAIVGMGKIAHDQHVPVLARSPDFELAACVTRQARRQALPAFATLQAMLAECPQIQAVAICTPPQARHALACDVITAGRHVLLEKPPAATPEEVEDLRGLAVARRVALFAAWHSRHAAGVEPARRWLLEHRVRRVSVSWKEDVHRWHPGQEWIWEPGGAGVFDAGINALSILTHLLPAALWLREAELFIPANRAAPIAARLSMSQEDGVDADIDLDWRQTGVPSRDIRIEADDGELLLSRGGTALHVNGTAVPVHAASQYASVYQRFATLVRAGAIDVDAVPLRLVAEALAIGKRTVVANFES